MKNIKYSSIWKELKQYGDKLINKVNKNQESRIIELKL